MKLSSALIIVVSAISAYSMPVYENLPGVEVRTGAVEPYIVTPGGVAWTGTIEKDGPEYTFKGSAESIIAQIMKIKPDFELASASQVNNETAFDKRSSTTILCDVGNIGRNYYADSSGIWDQIGYLRSLGNGVCGVSARSCVRISCSYGDAVWLCNDNDWYIQPRCSYLADYAERIVNTCQHHETASCYVPGTTNTCQPIDWWKVHGQQFDTDNYNVIVGLDNC